MPLTNRQLEKTRAYHDVRKLRSPLMYRQRSPLYLRAKYFTCARTILLARASDGTERESVVGWRPNFLPLII